MDSSQKHKLVRLEEMNHKTQKSQVSPGSIPGIRFCDNCHSKMRLKQAGDNRPPKYACEKCEYKHLAVVTIVFIIIVILLGALLFVFYLLVIM